jgi:hypothetical protein
LDAFDFLVKYRYEGDSLDVAKERRGEHVTPDDLPPKRKNPNAANLN